MNTFYVALLTSAFTQEAQNRGKNNHGVMSKVTLMSGALSLILLLFMIGQVLAWARPLDFLSLKDGCL